MAAATASQSAMQRFINSPAGPKTIHFWAPAMKWVCIKLQQNKTSTSLIMTLSCFSFFFFFFE
jgi:hypothetical protein